MQKWLFVSKTKKCIKVPIFKFIDKEIDKKRWIEALPNVLTFEITKDVGVCSLHWRENHATVPREVTHRMVDSESRARNDEMKEIEKDIISSWEDLK